MSTLRGFPVIVREKIDTQDGTISILTISRQ